jgi:hypothetical protein
MVSRAKYEKLINNFINRWGDQMGKDMASATTALWQWVKEYDGHMRSPSVEDKKLYIKRGANLLIKFVGSYTAQASSLEDSLAKCRLSLLRGEKTCSERTKADLSALIKDYNSFVQDVIGCKDAGSDYILSLLQRTSRMLGGDYEKIKSELEHTCGDLRIKQLRY